MYAKWELINYSITYNTNGGENASINPVSYNAETKITKLRNPRRAGYIFLGWYKTSDFTDYKIKSIGCGDSDLVLYAKWHVINYALIMIVLCIVFMAVFILIIWNKLYVKRKIEKFVSSVLEHNYSLDYLDGALKDKENPDVKKVIEQYKPEEIAFYKKYKVSIKRYRDKMKKDSEDKEQQKKKSENNEAYTIEEVDDKIKDLQKQILGIVETLEKTKSLENIDFFVGKVSDMLDFILTNKNFVTKESNTKINDTFELFEKNVYEKAKSMDGFSGTLLETKMKQAREKFKQILK
ncbi:MAG: InlB B-repeat-containing protein [Spirochaetota bacterium]|nr:InlB B-repeat-containing protein [Spirochaetota bacterium]